MKRLILAVSSRNLFLYQVHSPGVKVQLASVPGALNCVVIDMGFSLIVTDRVNNVIGVKELLSFNRFNLKASVLCIIYMAHSFVATKRVNNALCVH